MRLPVRLRSEVKAGTLPLPMDHCQAGLVIQATRIRKRANWFLMASAGPWIIIRGISGFRRSSGHFTHGRRSAQERRSTSENGTSRWLFACPSGRGRLRKQPWKRRADVFVQHTSEYFSGLLNHCVGTLSGAGGRSDRIRASACSHTLGSHSIWVCDFAKTRSYQG